VKSPYAPEAPPGFFRLTTWRGYRDLEAKAIRARWRKSLDATGIKSISVRSGGMVALFREGEEAISEVTARWHKFQDKKKTNGGEKP
jgi:hypothetical protein